MSDLSNSNQVDDEQKNHSLRENPNELALHSSSSRSKKKVKSAPTSATSVRHVKRSSSLTVIYMDELQNVDPGIQFHASAPTTTTTTIDTPISTASKREDVADANVNLITNSKHQHQHQYPLMSMLLPFPISRKQSQVAPTSNASHQPLEEIAIAMTERMVTVTVPDSGPSPGPGPGPGLGPIPDRASKTESIVLKSADNGDPASPVKTSAQQGAGSVDGHSTENFEEVCRICHDNPSRMTLLSPCLCKGSMGKVHRVCLERWLGESAKTNCEICGHEYETERRPRYSGWRSVVAWIRNPLAPTDTRNLFFDLACFFILTPLAAISAWLCVVGAKHYSFGQITLNPEGGSADMPLVHDEIRTQSRGQHGKYRNKNIEASNSTWTSIGLLTLTGTLLAAYYVWLFVAVRYHIQVWREWQARNFVVTISPLNPERIIQLREAQAAAEVAEMNDAEPERQQNSMHTQNTTINMSNHNNNNNNNNNGTRTSCSSDGSDPSSKTNRYQQRKLREKTLARAFEDTLSMESNGTISTEHASEDNAGPSNFKPSHHSDVDSVQGKVIVIPSEASFNGHETQNQNQNQGGGGGSKLMSGQSQSQPRSKSKSRSRPRNEQQQLQVYNHAHSHLHPHPHPHLHLHPKPQPQPQPHASPSPNANPNPNPASTSPDKNKGTKGLPSSMPGVFSKAPADGDKKF